MQQGQPARGLALIGALAVVAVATALGYEIIARHALSVSQSRQTLDGAQAASTMMVCSAGTIPLLATMVAHASSTSSSRYYDVDGVLRHPVYGCVGVLG